ncbi:MAG: hypothetical protein HY855_08930 [Burkholderiales bacterium]|nr:hypothetical protein [Burkholderiales bacterium]
MPDTKRSQDLLPTLDMLRERLDLATHGQSFPSLVKQAQLQRRVLALRSQGMPANQEESQLKALRAECAHRSDTARAALAQADLTGPVMLRRGSARQLARKGGSRPATAGPAVAAPGSVAWPAGPVLPGASSAGSMFHCPEPERFWWLGFDGAYASQNIPDAAAHISTDGCIGWRDLPRIDNNDTEQEWVSVLSLCWSGTVPRAGNFAFFGPDSSYVELKWKSAGSGLWGADAIITADVYSWVTVGSQTLAGYSAQLVNETKNTFGSASETVCQWVPTGYSGMFRAQEGDWVSVVVQLQVNTWSDDGRAWVEVNDFWVPQAWDAHHMFSFAD